MKFIFMCSIIVMSCSMCASGDLGIYPGLKLNANSEERRSSLENHKYPNFYTEYTTYPWENVPVDDYEEIKRKYIPEYDFMIPERLQLEEIIDWEKTQLNNRRGKHRAHYETPNHRYDFEYVYKQQNKPSNFKNYRTGIPKTNILDNVRMYSQEDDFNFNNDGNEEDNIPKHYHNNLEEQKKIFEENKQNSWEENRSSGESSDSSTHYEDHKNIKVTSKEQFTTDSKKKAKITSDPSEFAYAPSDPRFYKKMETTFQMDENTKQQKLKTLDDVNTSIGYKVKVKSNIDKKLRGNIQSELEKFHFKNVTDDGSSRNNGVVVVAVKHNVSDPDPTGVYIIAVVAGISAAATVGLIAVGIGWYNLQKHVKNASDAEYPAYGVTGPNKDMSPSSDKRLAQSAQMYHYQHQKQQIIAMERAPPRDRHGSVSDADSDDENEEGDYTVYECPGLAPTGEMEVKNPLFQDDPTPAQTTPVKTNDEDK